MTTTKPDTEEGWIELARRLKEARKEAGLSQAEIAEQTGLSRVAISEIESARRKVSSLELAALAKALGREPDHFLRAGGEESFGSSSAIGYLARTARQLAPEDQAQLVKFAEYLRQQSRSRRSSTR